MNIYFLSFFPFQRSGLISKVSGLRHFFFLADKNSLNLRGYLIDCNYPMTNEVTFVLLVAVIRKTLFGSTF